jgi:hypothetical protein
MPEIAALAEKLTLRQSGGRRTLWSLYLAIGATLNTTGKMPVARQLI